jgi:hypothetical protein
MAGLFIKVQGLPLDMTRDKRKGITETEGDVLLLVLIVVFIFIEMAMIGVASTPP